MKSNFPDISMGDIIDNGRLQIVFGCSSQGGMRRAHKTNSLVIISNHVKSIYGDRWDGMTLHYTGMGLIGDQRLDAAQNKTLNESTTNGVQLHLFEVFSEKEYTYQGEVKLSGTPYSEQQLDQKQNLRTVWIFPLTLVRSHPRDQDKSKLQKLQKKKEKQAKRLNDIELIKRARNVSKKTGSRLVRSTHYERDPYISELAKRRANGTCDLCDQHAPFMKTDGEPYLESHHIIWLSRGGVDSIDNTVALCPNCHRRMHVLDSKKDIELLSKRTNDHTTKEKIQYTQIAQSVVADWFYRLGGSNRPQYMTESEIPLYIACKLIKNNNDSFDLKKYFSCDFLKSVSYVADKSDYYLSCVKLPLEEINPFVLNYFKYAEKKLKESDKSRKWVELGELLINNSESITF